MLLNSDTQKGQNSFMNNLSRRFSYKKSFQNSLNYSVKQTKNISNFSSMSLSKSKKFNQNPRINIIINNNNPINYTGSSSSMYLNSFNSEKTLRKNKSGEDNSTFVFTGDNQSCMDNGQIIENYLKTPLENPIFECKSLSSISNREQNEIIPSQEKSFILCSSLSSNTPNTSCTLPKKNNNKKFMNMLRMINSESGNKNDEENNKQVTNLKKSSKFEVHNKEIPQKNNKKDAKKRIGFMIFFIINVIFYLYLMILMFQPSAYKLFYDNDHADYKYTISSLSQEKGIISNEKKILN